MTTPQSEKVGARIDFPAFELLRSHVFERPEKHAFFRDALPLGRHVTYGYPTGERRQNLPFGQAKVEELCSCFGQDNIARLEVPMNHSFRCA